VNARTLEIAFLVVIALLVLVGGEALLITISHSHGLAVSVFAPAGRRFVSTPRGTGRFSLRSFAP
jgi:hypothetical protein